ncbi:hypothetical protein COY62_02460 [bacterium (Candidatus Howlettbacteria) CG_4_10_14_0_8_um_filter_40_9]|nr:MAG: hypothetical protein COY62_02460 [bacterium (Candidatus Howlettbacteria) CG_4_10_14_0_8_um_filter_40_9]
MQYKVPQNIDIEDQVIGPLTLKQFLYLMVGFGILFVIKYSVPGFLFFPIAAIVGSFFLALAFFKPGDRPFEVYLMSVVFAMAKPRKRIWKKLPYVHKEEVVEKKEEVFEKNISSENLERLAFIIDSGGFEDELQSRGIVASTQSTQSLSEPSDLTDTIAASETSSGKINELLVKAKEVVKEKRKEPTIQEMATVKPTKKFEYESFGESASQKELETMFELNRKRQEERFADEKIGK